MNFKNVFKYLLLFLLIYFPVFGHMESIPIRMFDEARLAINAYNMYNDGDYIVTHFEGQPEMWNTKPPFMIWLQVLFMKLFGVSELAVRLPSAIGAFFTCIFMLFFSIRYLKDFWFGFISVIILITSVGYMNIHAVRTGDYDALLTLFTTLYALCFFIYIETDKKKFLYFAFLAIILSVLTKGIAGLLFIPVLLIYALIRKKIVELVKGKDIYIGLLSFVIIVIGYYLLREHYNPGYIKAVRENELGGRYLNTIEEHREGFWFYYKMLVNYHLIFWYLLVPCGAVVGFFHKEILYRRLAWYSTMLIVVYFFIISFSQTKLEWYTVPMYPFLAIIIGMFVHLIFKIIKDSKLFSDTLKYNVLPFIFLFIICIKPYAEITSRTFTPKVFPWEEDFYRFSYYLKDAIDGKHDLNGYTILNSGYGAHNQFYANILKDKGVNVIFTYEWRNIDADTKIIVHQQDVNDYIKQNYSFEIINNSGSIFLYKIKGKLKHD